MKTHRHKNDKEEMEQPMMVLELQNPFRSDQKKKSEIKVSRSQLDISNIENISELNLQQNKARPSSTKKTTQSTGSKKQELSRNQSKK